MLFGIPPPSLPPLLPFPSWKPGMLCRSLCELSEGTEITVVPVLPKSSMLFVWIRGSQVLSEATWKGCALDHVPLRFLGVGWKPDCFPHRRAGLNRMAGPGARRGAGAEARASGSGQDHHQTRASSVTR